MIKEFGFIRVGAIVPKIKVANPEYNSDEIIKQIKLASQKGVDIVTTPEMALTGSSCGDLLKQEILMQSTLENLRKIINETKELNIISIIGTPLEINNKIVSSAVVMQKGEVLAVIPNNEQLCEKNINIFGQEVTFGSKMILEDKENSKFSFGVLIGEKNCHDTNSIYNKVQNGAMIIFNLSANAEIVGSHDYRKQNILVQSKNNICAYVYCSAGVNESTTDMVFAGNSMISENGMLLKENERFGFESNLIFADIDVFRLSNDRNRLFVETKTNEEYIHVRFDELKNNTVSESYKIEREYAKYPFVPSDNDLRNERCKEIINIQACGLAKRLLHTGIKKTVIGLSGGQDSTLAFLVIVEAYKKLGIDNSNMIAITMPGFGTTGRTYENACKLAKAYGATLKEISIKEACMVHFKDIGLDENDRSITYENVQARERTQILMDVANKEGALVIGTGDLSELALGWCTYNGDHMSMYSVNSGVPKTLVRTLIKWVADNTLEATLYDIIDTPISPELLPTDEYGNLVQKTENTIGPYVLHDFFIYHFLRYGASPKKILALAKQTFEGNFEEEEIKKWLKMFIKRFFSQQFKRSCVPDGPKIGTIGLSPRGDLTMPSDANVEVWLKELG